MTGAAPLRSPTFKQRQAIVDGTPPSPPRNIASRTLYSTKTPSPLNPKAVRHARSQTDMFPALVSPPLQRHPAIEEQDDFMGQAEAQTRGRPETGDERIVTADALDHLTGTVASLTRSLSNRGFRAGLKSKLGFHTNDYMNFAARRRSVEDTAIVNNLSSPTSSTSGMSPNWSISADHKRKRPPLQKRRSGSRENSRLQLSEFGNLSLDYRRREFSQPIQPPEWRLPTTAPALPEDRMDVDETSLEHDPSILTPGAIDGALGVSSNPALSDQDDSMPRRDEILQMFDFADGLPSSPPSSVKSDSERLPHLPPARASKRMIAHSPARSLGDLPSLDADPHNDGPMDRVQLLQWRPELLKMIIGDHRRDEGEGGVNDGGRSSEMGEYEWTFQRSMTEICKEIVPLVFPVERVTRLKIVEFRSSNCPPHPGLKELVQQVVKKSFVRGSPLIIEVAHQCPLTTDIKALHRSLQFHPDSYILKNLNAEIKILPQFAFTNMLETAFPPSSVDLAFSAQDLNLNRVLHPDTRLRPAKSTVEVLSDAERDDLADNELASWLDLRAEEMRLGGTLLLNLYVRDGNTDTQQFVTADQLQKPSDTRWCLFSRVRAVLQRSINILVYEGKISPTLAQHCLNIAHWPRTRERLEGVLRGNARWEVIPVPETYTERPLVEDVPRAEAEMWAKSRILIRRLKYGAWLDLQQGLMDREKYARCVTEYCKSLYLDKIERSLEASGKNRHIIHLIVTELFDRFADMVDTKRLLEDPKLDIGVIVLRRTGL